MLRPWRQVRRRHGFVDSLRLESIIEDRFDCRSQLRRRLSRVEGMVFALGAKHRKDRTLGSVAVWMAFRSHGNVPAIDLDAVHRTVAPHFARQLTAVGDAELAAVVHAQAL